MKIWVMFGEIKMTMGSLLNLQSIRPFLERNFTKSSELDTSGLQSFQVSQPLLLSDGDLVLHFTPVSQGEGAFAPFATSVNWHYNNHYEHTRCRMKEEE